LNGVQVLTSTHRFGTTFDRFGISWMVVCEKQP
jgi:uncharacterized glyoxalase superfamily protein PhnB